MTEHPSKKGEPPLRELVLIRDNAIKQRQIKHLSFAPMERSLDHMANSRMSRFETGSFYTAATGGITSVFIEFGGLASPLLLLSGTAFAAGMAGVAYARRINLRGGRFNRAFKCTEDRAVAIRIEPYSRRAKNSYAFNALMSTPFGRSVLNNYVFNSPVKNSKELRDLRNELREGVYPELLEPLLFDYLAATSFLDMELERYRQDMPGVVAETESSINKLAKAWVAENMQPAYDDYQEQKRIMDDAEREQAGEYLLGLVESIMPISGLGVSDEPPAA